MHLGHARSFLLAYWQMRALGGRLLLRLEDLDTQRVHPELVDRTLRDLEWLGLDWDGQPELQSQNLLRISAAAAELAERGSSYACACTRSDLRSVSAPHSEDGEVRYPGTCRGRFASLAEAEAMSGRPCGQRLVVPPGTVTITDGVAGPYRADVAAETGDFLIVRRDKVPAYQLAVVVDDAAQGVTHVLRGDDLLGSALRQWHLQRALGLPSPEWFHVPLVCDENGRRLAKRHDALSLTTLRAAGVDPRAVVAWVAESAGIPAPERVTARELTPLFSLEAVPKQPVRVSNEVVSELLG